MSSVRTIWWACPAGSGPGWRDVWAVARDPRGTWWARLAPLPVGELLAGDVQADTAAVMLPDCLDPALATLCVPLVRAVARADALAARQNLRFDPYDLDAGLVHAELCRRAEASATSPPQVWVTESEVLRASAARALGARVDHPAAQPPPGPAQEPVAGKSGEPTGLNAAAANPAVDPAVDPTVDPAAVAAAVDIVAAQPWWFQPLITGAMTLDELRAVGPSVLAEHVAVVVAA